MIPNSAADRAFLAEPRNEGWAAWCEGDVMRRIWGICAWSDTVIEEIACRSTLCRVTVNMPSPGVLASLYTNIALSHLYGDGVSGAEWNELTAPVRRYRAVFYLRYRDPLAVGRFAIGTDSDSAAVLDLTDAIEIDHGDLTDAVATLDPADATDAMLMQAFDEIDAKLDALVAPATPKGRSRAQVHAAGTGTHVVSLQRPRTLTPISPAAMSRAAAEIDIVEITPSTVRSMR